MEIKTFDSFEVILETKDGNFEFGEQGTNFETCLEDATNKYKSGEYNHVSLDGCFEDGSENIAIWYDGKFENTDKIPKILDNKN